MRALSIRQPYAEQILRGTKRIEFRNRPVRFRERVYIYASLKPGPRYEFEKLGLAPGDLPTGVLVGTVHIVGCTGRPGEYRWQMAFEEALQAPAQAASQEPTATCLVLSFVRKANSRCLL
jgi:hypothetical protein